jgi:hypothetical protein
MLIKEKYLWGNAYNLYQVISHSMICLVFWLDISVISIGIGLAIQAFPVYDKIDHLSRHFLVAKAIA